jgi:hypothetical protein
MSLTEIYTHYQIYLAILAIYASGVIASAGGIGGGGVIMPLLLVVGGFDIKRIFKHPRRNEFQIIENTLFEFTNSSEDLRLGLNGIPRAPTVIVDAAFLPSVETYRLLVTDPNDSKIIYSERESDCKNHVCLTTKNLTCFL